MEFKSGRFFHKHSLVFNFMGTKNIRLAEGGQEVKKAEMG